MKAIIVYGLIYFMITVLHFMYVYKIIDIVCLFDGV